MNDYQFKLVKFEGEFVWHTHQDTDEVFLVVQGEMQIGFRNHEVTIKAGELFVVHRGIEHINRPARKCHALITAPRGVAHTGHARFHQPDIFGHDPILQGSPSGFRRSAEHPFAIPIERKKLCFAPCFGGNRATAH